MFREVNFSISLFLWLQQNHFRVHPCLYPIRKLVVYGLYSPENVLIMSRNFPWGQVEYPHLLVHSKVSHLLLEVSLMHSRKIQLFGWKEFLKLCIISTLEGIKSFDVIITSRWYALTIIFKPAGYSAALETIKPSRLEGKKVKYF